MLTAEQRNQVELIVRLRSGDEHRLLKAKILLLADQGCTSIEIIKSLRTNKSMVYKVRKKFAEDGLEAVLTRKQRKDGPAVQIAKAARTTQSATQQGSGRSEMEEREVIALLWRTILAETGGQQTEWARRRRIPLKFLNKVLLGHERPSSRILAALGLKKVKFVRYLFSDDDTRRKHRPHPPMSGD